MRMIPIIMGNVINMNCGQSIAKLCLKGLSFCAPSTDVKITVKVEPFVEMVGAALELDHDWSGRRFPSVGGLNQSSRRCSNAGSIMCKDKPENRDQNIDEEQIVSVDYNVSHAEMAGQADHSTVEIDQNEEKWLDKFPVTQHNKALDIEEGQIITEEVSLNPATENFGSENIAEIVDERKKSLVVHEHAAKENKVGEDYDSPRILEVMAKMEKRRKRFKEPIALKKETERIPNPQDDPVLETIAEPMQQRPARKRRWGGS
ncbi:hypothetical protein Acr_24g0000970 [Actinidia rufa]|uniref:FIP1[V]-like protein n=1 Tax=Actinidia rufa TaxID=165716 RepID=A0A7J0GSU7_9ERIC|nr:hypothetical protein Acr_24g0000970 [Actinidia rufa]